MISLDELYTLLSDEKNGLVTKFTTEAQLAPLRNILIDVFNTKGKKVELDATKKHNNKLLANDKEIINYINKIDKATGGIFNLASNFTSGSGLFGGLFSKIAGATRLLYTAGRTLYNAGMKYMEYTSQYYKNLKVLSDAGISLRDGFDETFTTYAAMAKLSQENYAKLINDSSKFIMRYNQVALKSQKSGEEILSIASSRLMGHYGLDDKQIRTAITYITDYTDVVAGSELRQRDLASQTERLVQNFKALSRATGVSIENYLEMNKQQEKEILVREIKADPKRAAKFSAAEATFGTDAALYMETGIPNEKVLQMMGDARGLRALQHAREGYMKAETDENGLTKKGTNTLITYFNESITGPIDSIKRDVANMPSAFQYLANNFLTEHYGRFLDTRELNEKGANKIMNDMADNETSIISQFSVLNQSVDIIKELMIRKFIPDSKKAAAFFKALSGGASAIQEVLWGEDYQRIKANQAGVDYDKMEVTERKLQSGGFFTSEEGQKRRANRQIEDSRNTLLNYLKSGKTIEDYNKDASMWHLLIANRDDKGQLNFFNKDYYENYNKLYPQYKAWKEFGNNFKEKNGIKYYYDELSGKHYTEEEYNLRLKSLESRMLQPYNYTQKLINENINNSNKEKFDNQLNEIITKLGDIVDSNKKTAENTEKQVKAQQDTNKELESSNAIKNTTLFQEGFAVRN